MLCDPVNFYPSIDVQGVKDLYKLAEIVCNCHFAYVDYSKKEELTSAAIVKAIDFVKNDDFDPNRSSLKNVLYTAMRNEMKNTLYRLSKDVVVDDEIISGVNESKSTVDGSYSCIQIGDEYLNSCRCSSRDKEKIKSSLSYMGFFVDSKENKFYEEVS